NFTSPIAEHQNMFGYTIAREVHRPHYTWVPSFALRLILGEMSTVVLDTQKVLPNKLQALDFEFKYPNLKLELVNLVHYEMDYLKMKQDNISHILLFIAGLLFITNGILVFEKPAIMIVISMSLVIIGLLTLVISIILIYKKKHNLVNKH